MRAAAARNSCERDAALDPRRPRLRRRSTADRPSAPPSRAAGAGWNAGVSRPRRSPSRGSTAPRRRRARAAAAQRAASRARARGARPRPRRASSAWWTNARARGPSARAVVVREVERRAVVAARDDRRLRARAAARVALRRAAAVVDRAARRGARARRARPTEPARARVGAEAAARRRAAACPAPHSRALGSAARAASSSTMRMHSEMWPATSRPRSQRLKRWSRKLWRRPVALSARAVGTKSHNQRAHVPARERRGRGERGRGRGGAGRGGEGSGPHRRVTQTAPTRAPRPGAGGGDAPVGVDNVRHDVAVPELHERLLLGGHVLELRASGRRLRAATRGRPAGERRAGASSPTSTRRAATRALPDLVVRVAMEDLAAEDRGRPVREWMAQRHANGAPYAARRARAHVARARVAAAGGGTPPPRGTTRTRGCARHTHTHAPHVRARNDGLAGSCPAVRQHLGRARAVARGGVAASAPSRSASGNARQNTCGRSRLEERQSACRPPRGGRRAGCAPPRGERLSRRREEVYGPSAAAELYHHAQARRAHRLLRLHAARRPPRRRRAARARACREAVV